MNTIFYSTGKKKTSIAKVWLFLKPDFTNKVIVNGISLEKYFLRKYLIEMVKKPIYLFNDLGNYNIIVKVKGGGLSSQANAIKYGISKSILKKNPSLYKSKLRECGYLTRDTRIVERKKFGMSGARKRYQYSKR